MLDLFKARVQSGPQDGRRVICPQLEPGSQPGLVVIRASSVNSMLGCPPPGNLTRSIGCSIPGCTTVATGPQPSTVSKHQASS